MIVFALQNETVDAIAYRLYGKTKGIVEQIYHLNPGLCELSAQLPMGTRIIVPETVTEPQKHQINLWD
ncbi:tail protein X [Utexia brackfieldae]|uniref:tail protein X n=1 Tax=Utexia brackfieldae TaxID=3074108 RepID=UPI00370D096E